MRSALFLGISLSTVLSAGCAVLAPVSSSISGPEFSQPTADSVPTLQPSRDAMAFQRIQQAAAMNAVVIVIRGDDRGPRLVQLPQRGEAVYLDELLQQTGLRAAVGRMEAVIWRATPEAPAGAKLIVRFKKNGKVDPLTDYAIRAGDRIEISESDTTWLSEMTGGIL